MKELGNAGLTVNHSVRMPFSLMEEGGKGTGNGGLGCALKILVRIKLHVPLLTGLRPDESAKLSKAGRTGNVYVCVQKKISRAEI